jgi:Immunity protein 35
MSTEPDAPSNQRVIDIQTARTRVNEYLRKEEERARFFGSGLPDYRPDKAVCSLVIVDEREYDFGWTFCFNTKEYVETGNILHSLVGNEPLFVDRRDGHVYTSWVIGDDDRFLENYIEGYRSGRRSRVD